MVHLILIAVCSQRVAIARLIAGALTRYGDVRLHTQLALQHFGGGRGEDFCVAVTPRLEELSVPGSVLVLPDQCVPRRMTLDESVVTAMGADNRRACRMMRGMPNTVISCGTGVRDTLTVSSMTPERAIICVQRSIPTANGGLVEPCEISVLTGGADIRAVLLCAGTLAVCGCDIADGMVELAATAPC